MPAPQASMMKQLARLKFASFQLKVPLNWQPPQGDPGAQHYADAFKPEEKNTAPAVGAPPLFLPASMNKYHTDTQKMHHAKVGAYIDGICDAVCSAWSQWQATASMTGILVNAVTASMGQIVAPPLAPLILAAAPKLTPMEMKYATAIANTLSAAWLTFTATVKIPGLPFYPAFAAFPGPLAPPMPNVPVPFAVLTQVPISISTNTLKMQMVAALGDVQAPFHAELFEAIAHAFEQCYNLWKVSTMVTNVLGTGPIPTFAPPYVPVGPVLGGMATMAPGGFV
ncbi:MAG: hypothetical protein M3680_19875 [Myxococcota bacterium]|nr:hypothetical protein [Myxococcota bacterium]